MFLDRSETKEEFVIVAVINRYLVFTAEVDSFGIIDLILQVLRRLSPFYAFPAPTLGLNNKT